MLSLAISATAGAQSQREADAHGNFSRGTSSRSNAWGAGAQVQLVWGASGAPVQLGTSLGGDYTKADDGPAQWNASADAVVQPGGGHSVTPYVGAGAGANWSSGSSAEWRRARLGLDMLAGAQVKLGSRSSAPNLKAEERFGYVRGQEHTLATRLGIAVSF